MDPFSGYQKFTKLKLLNLRNINMHTVLGKKEKKKKKIKYLIGKMDQSSNNSFHLQSFPQPFFHSVFQQYPAGM